MTKKPGGLPLPVDGIGAAKATNPNIMQMMMTATRVFMSLLLKGTNDSKKYTP